MDYITRRNARKAGHAGAFLRRSNPKYPRLSALGVRIEDGDTVSQCEIAQALRDLNIKIDLPPGVRIPAAKLEAALAGYTPQFLRESIDAFLDALAANAREEAETKSFMEAAAGAMGAMLDAEESAIPSDVLLAGRLVFKTDAAVREWALQPALWANWKTPLQLIREGKSAEVIGALKGLAHGNFL